MNPAASVFLLMVIALIVFLLPLLPVAVELHGKSDVQPLQVIQQHSGEASYFGDSFRVYIDNIRPVLNDCFAQGTAAKGTLPDGAPCLVLGRGEDAPLIADIQAGGTCDMILASSTDLELPSNTFFPKDIYSNGCVNGGPSNTYRAVLAEHEVRLGAGSRVMRWVQAGTEFTAQSQCQLFSRVSAGRLIRLLEDCRFIRLHAPRIETGSVSPEAADTHVLRRHGNDGVRRLHNADLSIAAGELLRGDLVVRGRLTIGEAARIEGSVKCEKDMVLGPRVEISGTVVTERHLQVGPYCILHGPVIAERGLLIARGTRCGARDMPTTVTAPRITVETGVVVFGTMWAREQGEVIAAV
ncbi:MAG: polymer-forming cytoskeletal protein [Acidobacteria bacterium]|nr:polymer-forming cytoskeletal protein [Acidobacteriota bacterium]